MQDTRSDELVNSREASTALGCTVQHLRLLIRQDKLLGRKLGRDWFVDRSSLLKFKAERYQASESPKTVLTKESRQLTLFPQLGSITNVASVPQRSPLRYPGGKTWLIPIVRHWLTSIEPRPKLLLEPFAGGGGIGLAAAFERFVDKSWLVELDPDVASLWRTMLSPKAKDLQARILAFECTLDSVNQLVASESKNDLDYAFQTLVRNRVSRGGILAPGAGLVKKGEANKGIASRWYPETLARRIGEIYQHRARLAFTEQDGLTAIDERTEDPRTAYFVDPPYPVAGRRLYKYHELDHEMLLEKLSCVSGPVLITYDQNREIQIMAEAKGFLTREIPMKSTHHEKKLELLISKDFSWLPRQTVKTMPDLAVAV